MVKEGSTLQGGFGRVRMPSGHKHRIRNQTASKWSCGSFALIQFTFLGISVWVS